MNITIAASRDEFEKALRAARQLGEGQDIRGLNAPADAGLRGRLDAVWDTIETALRSGYQYGREMAENTLQEAIAQAEELLRQSGNRARDVHEALLQRLQVFLHNFLTSALTQIPTTVTISGKNLTLGKVTYTQKLVVTGSIKTNLTEVFSLTSSGELQVAADYIIVP